MSEIDETNDNIISLTDDEGNDVNFEVLLTFDHEDSFYVAMLPTEPETEEEAEEVLLMRLVEEDEEDVFYPIESEEELDAVWETFQKLYDAEEEDDDCCEEGCDCGCCSHDHED